MIYANPKPRLNQSLVESTKNKGSHPNRIESGQKQNGSFFSKVTADGSVLKIPNRPKSSQSTSYNMKREKGKGIKISTNRKFNKDLHNISDIFDDNEAKELNKSLHQRSTGTPSNNPTFYVLHSTKQKTRPFISAQKNANVTKPPSCEPKRPILHPPRKVFQKVLDILTPGKQLKKSTDK
jgi:hypothetical protein